MINHKHKFIYLHTPKTGGMSIGSALFEALGIEDNYQSFHIHYDDLNKEILKDYFVFTFVRNPWDRIVSDYRYKEEINTNFSFDSFSNNPQYCYEQQYKTSVKPTDINFFNNHRDTSNYFSEFIHTISQLDFLKGKFNHNINTLPFIDFIGRYENIEQDFKYVCDKIGITAKLPHKNFTNWKNNARIDYVIHLIKTGETDKLTLDAISKKAGFVSRSTFISSFKLRTGLTPSEFIETLS